MKYDKDQERFVPTQLKQTNTINVDIKFDPINLIDLGGKVHEEKVPVQRSHEAIADTGAAICCTPISEIEKMGLSKSTILKSNLKLYAADRRQLDIIGCAPVQISTFQQDEKVTINPRQTLHHNLA